MLGKGSAPKAPTSISKNPSPSGMSKSSAYRFGAHMVIKDTFDKKSAVAPGLVDVLKGFRGVGTLARDLGRAVVASGRGSARGALRGADIGARAVGETLGSAGSKRVRIAGQGIGGLAGGAAGATVGMVTGGPRAFYNVLFRNKSIKDAIGPRMAESQILPNVGKGATEAERVVNKLGRNTALTGLGIVGATTLSDFIYNLNRYTPLPQPRRGHTQINPYEYRPTRN